jgi:hypothetical protein
VISNENVQGVAVADCREHNRRVSQTSTDTMLIKGPFKRTQRDTAGSAVTDLKAPKRKNDSEYDIQILFVYFHLHFQST